MEIDLNALIEEANALDARIAASPDIPAPGAKRQRKPRTIPPAAGGTAPAAVAQPEVKKVEVIRPMNPELPIVIGGLTQTGTAMMEAWYGWIEPGEGWHKQFAGALARLIHPYIQSEEKYADILLVIGCASMYVGANTMLPKPKRPVVLARPVEVPKTVQ